jgi:hypothetical protein
MADRPRAGRRRLAVPEPAGPLAAGQPQRLGRQLVAVGRAGPGLDDERQQRVAGVGVGLVGAGLEGRAQPADGGHRLVVVHRLVVSRGVGAGEPAAVVEQLLDRGRHHRAAEAGHEVARPVAQRQPALVGQVEHRRGRDGLGDRADAEHRVAGVGRSRRAVGLAVTGEALDRARAQHGYRAAEPPLCPGGQRRVATDRRRPRRGRVDVAGARAGGEQHGDKRRERGGDGGGRGGDETV